MEATVDHHSMIHDLPHYREKYEAAKKVNVYYVPAHDEVENAPAFFYVLASAMLHDEMVASLKDGSIPDFAVVIESGYGEPTQEIKEKIKASYGFDHDLCANNDNNLMRKAAAN
jgi:superoxide dismutase